MNSTIAFAVGLAAILAAIVMPISTPKSAYASDVPVSIVSGASANPTDKSFDPNPAKVNVGDTVVWTNNDSTLHTVTSGDPSGGANGIFGGTKDSPTYLAPKATQKFTFDKAGTFPYFCTLHPTMVGSVVVGAGGGGGTMETKVTATIDGKSYDITYNSTTSKATEATIQSGQSVTVKFDKAGDVELTLPKAMISGVNSVMAGDQDLLKGSTPTVNPDGSSTIKFTVPDGSTTVVIKGATVIPEFPVIGVILAISVSAIIAYTKFARNGTMLGRA